MLLGCDRFDHIRHKGLVNRLIRQLTARRVPILQGRNRERKRVCDNVIFNRLKKHLPNRDDKGQKNKEQKRRNQRKSANFLIAQ